MKSKEPSQDIDDILLDEKSADFDADDLFDLETNEIIIFNTINLISLIN